MDLLNLQDFEGWTIRDLKNLKFSDLSKKIEDNLLFADLHIHSRFSRACSKNITLVNLVKWARIKGLNLLGTGDFTHPEWFREIKGQLKENNKGFYYYKDSEGEFPFVITGEVSLVFTQLGKGRRIHLVILVPDIETAEKINLYLDLKGRRDYDGRPIFNISCEKFAEDMMKISLDIEIIPAHIWTPWFGIFGSESGFDSLKEAFGEQEKNIHAIETGMSSDPEMNWKLKQLNDKAIVSFSDSHSFWPFRIGREATVFKKTDSYKELIRQIREKDFIITIETDPAYGKYHYDGHRKCNFSSSFEKTRALKGICPVCGKPLVIGVENRIEDLRDNPNRFIPEKAKQFFRILPLHEIIALYLNSKMETKKVWEVYNSLIAMFENEFNILLRVPKEKFLQAGVELKLIELIFKNREGKISVKPGYDGEYGVAELRERQGTLF
ncbi:MAG: endonuclease Q family protein [Nanoarchaeota archaeon]